MTKKKTKGKPITDQIIESADVGLAFAVEKLTPEQVKAAAALAIIAEANNQEPSTHEVDQPPLDLPTLEQLHKLPEQSPKPSRFTQFMDGLVKVSHIADKAMTVAIKHMVDFVYMTAVGTLKLLSLIGMCLMGLAGLTLYGVGRVARLTYDTVMHGWDKGNILARPVIVE